MVRNRITQWNFTKKKKKKNLKKLVTTKQECGFGSNARVNPF